MSTPPSPLWKALRAIALAACLLAFVLGCLADLLLVVEGIAAQANPGDGLRMFFPVILALVFMPIQLLAVFVGAAELARRRYPALLEHPWIVSGGPFVAGASLLCTGVPGVVMAAVIVVRPFVPYEGQLHEIIWSIAEPMTLVWAVLWGLGVVMAGVAFGVFDRYVQLLTIGLWPICGLIYMTSGS